MPSNTRAGQPGRRHRGRGLSVDRMSHTKSQIISLDCDAARKCAHSIDIRWRVSVVRGLASVRRRTPSPHSGSQVRRNILELRRPGQTVGEGGQAKGCQSKCASTRALKPAFCFRIGSIHHRPASFRSCASRTDCPRCAAPTTSSSLIPTTTVRAVF